MSSCVPAAFTKGRSGLDPRDGMSADQALVPMLTRGRWPVEVSVVIGQAE